MMTTRALWSWLALLLGLSSQIPALAQVPFVFTPSGRDDGLSLAAALRTYRWVQINGTDIRIDTAIELLDEAGRPLKNIVIEPAPGHDMITVHSNLPQSGTNPNNVPFNYSGRFEPGSYLTSLASVGATTIIVRDPASLTNSPIGFIAGEYLCLNDTSLVPALNWPAAPEVADGAMEVRQIVGVGRLSSSELALSLDLPLRRSHNALIAVARCKPIQNAVFRNLRFTSDGASGPRVGIHLHAAFNARLSRITSIAWRGFALILLDSGGRNNVVSDSFATGVNWGTDKPNGWGIAVEGQENTLIINSGAERFSEGIVINYSTSTVAVDSTVRNCNVIGLDVMPDWMGNPSIDSGFQGGTVVGGGFGVHVGPNCQNCRVDVEMIYPLAGILIGLGAKDTMIAGSVLWPYLFGVGIDSIYGGPGDGAVSSRGTFFNCLATCSSTKLVLINGPIISPHPPSPADQYYSYGPIFAACP
jgi:hypothetical protein